jgi:hypothetical protein
LHSRGDFNIARRSHILSPSQLTRMVVLDLGRLSNAEWVGVSAAGLQRADHLLAIGFRLNRCPWMPTKR